MDTSVIFIIIIAAIGPLLVYLTRYVDKGRTAAASRLWFVSVCAYVVYYLLASGDVLDARIEPYYFALLWPIPAILALWLVDRIAAAESPVPYFKWIIYFMVGLIFAFLVDLASGATGWYAYNATINATASITSPVNGMQIPAMALLMLGVLMVGVFFLSDPVFKRLKKKVSPSSATFALIGLAFILGGIVWVVTELVMGLFK
ncbi:MAG: hypothetical protein A4E28_01488 [Methanocella sp. PtaU1.Bin125]|nr:MAG: hypothetical protein A4E28_01488 [Methanocella sp. PtaU1.Bin125]